MDDRSVVVEMDFISASAAGERVKYAQEHFGGSGGGAVGSTGSIWVGLTI